MKKIWLAGGCFWGVEAYFAQIKGVMKTQVGYGQGTTAEPTYQQVCSGMTGYAEVCEVVYDETILPLQSVLEHFFRVIDPTILNRQGPDRGTQYRTGVYYSDEADKSIISDFISKVRRNYADPIVVEVAPVVNFYLAEEYHQAYLQKNPGGYCHVDLQAVKLEDRKLNTNK